MVSSNVKMGISATHIQLDYRDVSSWVQKSEWDYLSCRLIKMFSVAHQMYNCGRYMQSKIRDFSEAAILNGYGCRHGLGTRPAKFTYQKRSA